MEVWKMLVKYWMRKDVPKVGANDSIQHAVKLMQEHAISMLPVMRNDELLGVVTDMDLKRVSASDKLMYVLSQIEISEIMDKNPVTIPPDFTIEEAAAVILEKDTPGAPVVDEEDRVVGIMTNHEISKVLSSLSGLGRLGVHFAFQLEDRPGSIKDITDLLRSYGGRLISILTSYHRSPAGFRSVYIRVHSLDRLKMNDLLDELSQIGKILYIVDHRNHSRKEFI
jgi:acetoin utilization protein AcuB